MYFCIFFSFVFVFCSELPRNYAHLFHFSIYASLQQMYWDLILTLPKIYCPNTYYLGKIWIKEENLLPRCNIHCKDLDLWVYLFLWVWRVVTSHLEYAYSPSIDFGDFHTTFIVNVEFFKEVNSLMYFKDAWNSGHATLLRNMFTKVGNLCHFKVDW